MVRFQKDSVFGHYEVQVGDKKNFINADGDAQEITVVALIQRSRVEFAKVRFPDSHFEILPTAYLLARGQSSAGRPLRPETGDLEAEAQLQAHWPEQGSSRSASTGIGNLDALSGSEFEALIITLLERLGFRADMMDASEDGGVDVVATLDRPLTGGRFLIQCKRYAPESLVGAATVQEFYGALASDRRAIKGILITTSGFTAQAQEFAAGLPIELVGRDQLERLLAQHGL